MVLKMPADALYPPMAKRQKSFARLEWSSTKAKSSLSSSRSGSYLSW